MTRRGSAGVATVRWVNPKRECGPNCEVKKRTVGPIRERWNCNRRSREREAGWPPSHSKLSALFLFHSFHIFTYSLLLCPCLSSPLPPLPVPGGLVLLSSLQSLLPSTCPPLLPTPTPFLIHFKNSKQLPCPQGSKPSTSKKFSTIATAIGLKPKKTPAPVQNPVSPILPLHTGDIETPPRPTKPAVKPVPVAVGWSDPRALQPDEFLHAYPQSVFSTDLDPFASAAKYSDGIPSVSDSLRFSTISEVSVLGPHLHRDVSHTHDGISFASSSSLSQHRSDMTSDSSPISSPLLSPVMSGQHLSR